jgi:hypothetical protein
MTMRYAHLSPKAKRHAVSLLDQPAPEWSREGGDEARSQHSHSTGTGGVKKNS